MHTPVRVLFLSEANAARSQMAEGLLRNLAGRDFEVHSAGLDPQPLHPLAVKAMAEVDIDISGQSSTHLNEFMEMQFDYVITLCERIASSCTAFLRDNETLHWQCADPREAQGTEEERLAVFRRVRDEIRAQLAHWLAEVRQAAAAG